MKALTLPLLLVACQSSQDVATNAGAGYMIPFTLALGAKNATKPCAERVAIAKKEATSSMEFDKEIGEKAKKLHDDESFRERLTKMTEKREQLFKDFAKTCPAEAPEIITLFATVESAFGLDGALPPLAVDAGE